MIGIKTIWAFLALSMSLIAQQVSNEKLNSSTLIVGGPGGDPVVTCATPVCPLTSLPSYTLRFGKLRGDPALTNSYNASQVINLPVDGGLVTAPINATACKDNQWYFRVFSEEINGSGQSIGNTGRWAGYNLDATSNDTMFNKFGCGGYHGVRVTASNGISWGGPLQDIPWNNGQTYMDKAGVYWIKINPTSTQVGQTFNVTITAQIGVTTQELCQDIRESREVTWTLKLLIVSGTCPDITPPMVTSTSVAGASGFITLSATATDNIGVSKVDFYVDGVFRGTATTAPYRFSLDSTNLANGPHTLIVKAFDAAGNVGGSTGISFSTNNTFQPPTITSQPGTPIGLVEGATTSFSVAASGTGPLNYQWTKNAAPIPGATFPSYTTPPLTVADDGAIFLVTVSNSAGSVTSNSITIQVRPATPTLTATITSPSADVTINSGASVSFQGTGISNDPNARLSFNWNFGDGSQPNNGSYTTHTFTASSIVTLTVTDVYGTHASAVRNITVNTGNLPGLPPMATAGNFIVGFNRRSGNAIYSSGVSFDTQGLPVTNWTIFSEDGTQRTDFVQLRDRSGQYHPIFTMYDGIPGNITRVFGRATYSDGSVGTSNVVSIVSYYSN